MLETPTLQPPVTPEPAPRERPRELSAAAAPAGPAPRTGEMAPVASRTRGRHRPLLLLLRTLLAVSILGGTLLAGAELATPGVAGAPARVTAIDLAHGTVPVPADPSWRVSQATVAAEDSGFYGDDGVDPAGLLRALWGWATGVDEGGSTITEQLAKVVYTNGGTTITDRVAQVALALKLNGDYTKPAVLSMYLSAIYFGNGSYGVLAASEGYFGLSPGELSWGQASLLAGLPQDPTLLDPLDHLAAARVRQSYVLDRLVATGVLTRAQADAAATEPLDLR